MITCREFVDIIGAFLEGELTAEQSAAFDAHLAECPWCVAYVEDYRKTVALGRGAFGEPEAPVPDDVPEDLVAAVRAALRSRPSPE